MRETQTRSRTRARVVLTLAAVAATSMLATTSASASAATERVDDRVSAERIEQACARVPEISERVDAHIVRLSGDAETRGSLLWLEQKIDTATANGNEQKAAFLQNRLTVRTARLELLEVRATALDELQVMCDEHS